MKTVLGLAAVALLAQPAVAQVYEPRDYGNDREVEYVEVNPRAGFRVEGKVFFESLSDPEEDEGVIYEFGNGFGYGVEAGFDIAAGDTLAIGPYASYEWSNVERCVETICVRGKDFFAVGIHAGLATGPNSQVFAKLGYSELTTEFDGSFTDDFTGELVVFDIEDSGGGFVIGLGYEQGFGENFYGRANVEVGENYDILETFDIQRVTAGVSLGTRF